MAEVKWIKIVTDVFDDEKILLIETLPEADSLIVIWFKILCLAGKQNNNGVFLMNDKIPYTEEMLAAILRRPLNTVKLALKTFEDFGMIEVVDGVIVIPNWDKHQSLDKLEMAREQTRKRVAKHREKQKLKALGLPEGNKIEETCVYCGKRCKTTIDHIIPKSKGGTDDSDNLVESCTECNSSKKDRTLLEFLNNCVHINYVGADIDRILNNPKLNKYVDYDGNKFIERYCNVTETLRNADRIDKIRLEEDKNRKDKEKNIKHKYGEYKHVLLTDNEYKRLLEQYGSSNLEIIITYLDEYLEMKGTKYKSHYMVIKKWGAEAALKKRSEEAKSIFESFLES